jgi:chemotaxis protein MotB
VAKKLSKITPLLKETAASKVEAVYKPARANVGVSHSADQGGHEEGEGEGGWIFSYADLITILMMFFILLLSISSLDEQKFQELKSALASTTKADSGAGAGAGAGAGDTGNLGESVKISTISKSKALETYIGKVSLMELSEKAQQLAASDSNTQIMAIMQMLIGAVDKESLNKSQKNEQLFNQAKKEIEAIAEANRIEQVSAEAKASEVKILLPSYLLFDRQGELTQKGKNILNQLSSGMVGLGENAQIAISSYVSRMNQDDPSKATLTSSTRARKVFDYLVAKKVDSDSISIAGYGNSKKLLREVDSYGNSIEQVRKINDRVEISIRKRVKDLKKDNL